MRSGRSSSSPEHWLLSSARRGLPWICEGRSPHAPAVKLDVLAYDVPQGIVQRSVPVTSPGALCKDSLMSHSGHWKVEPDHLTFVQRISRRILPVVLLLRIEQLSQPLKRCRLTHNVSSRLDLDFHSLVQTEYTVHCRQDGSTLHSPKQKSINTRYP